MLYKFNGKPLKMLGGSLHVWNTYALPHDDPVLSSWFCWNCGQENTEQEDGDYCRVCSEYRWDAPANGDETWVCPNCNTVNSHVLDSQSDNCSECGYNYNYGFDGPPMDDPVSLEYDWECPNCHHVNHFYDNNQQDHYCEDCGFNEMNGFDTPPDSGEIPPEEPPVDPETELDWYCQNCNEMNDRGSYVCWNCGYDRDGNPPME